MKTKNAILVSMANLLPTLDRPYIEDLPDDRKQTYLNRERAVEMYLKGYSNSYIEEQTGIPGPKISVFVRKCFEPDEYGNVPGFTALIPHRRNGSNMPRKNSIARIMEDHPEIKEELVNQFFKSSVGMFNYMNYESAYKFFVKKLRDAGYTNDDYPFNLKYKGRRQLTNYLKNFALENPDISMKRESELAQIKKKATGQPSNIPEPVRPYEIVEVDGHLMDFMYVIDPVRVKENQVAKVAYGRPLIFAAIDVATRCILSYTVEFRTSYDQYTVLLTIKRMIKSPEDTWPHDKPTFPQNLAPEYEWSVPETIKCDNAVMHLAEKVLLQKKRFGFQYQYGPIKQPVYRPHIERFFRTLRMMLSDNLASSTGSHPKDLHRVDPEKGASYYAMTKEKCLYFIEEAINSYNNRFHEGINGTPMELMQQKVEEGFLPSKLNPTLRGDNFKVCYPEKHKVVGTRKNGEKVHINMFKMEYSSEYLKDQYILSESSQNLIVMIDPEDINTVEAYYEDGAKLGTLSLQGKAKNLHVSASTIKKLNDISNKGTVDRENKLTPLDLAIITIAEEGRPSKRDSETIRNAIDEVGESIKEIMKPIEKKLTEEELREKESEELKSWKESREDSSKNVNISVDDDFFATLKKNNP